LFLLRCFVAGEALTSSNFEEKKPSLTKGKNELEKVEKIRYQNRR